jgi:glutamyl-tRNA synthetase
MPAPRLRFAPSPTGYLHIGGARTALFNWLYARKHQGTFILRIEDTDQARSTQASVDVIFEAMRWLGLDWDEGPFVGGPSGPYFQTQRLELYREFSDKLIASGHAYKSYETREELSALREAHKAKTGRDDFRYDSPWRDGREQPREGAPYVVRFKMPRDERPVGFDDLVYGHIEKRHVDMDDWIMLRPDGIPTYNFGAAIDDHTMGISHVARGDDHINNTPPQVAIFQALGATHPQYAHLPMILGEDKKKLSKRTGSVSVTDYRDQGYLPHALVNFLARMGWSHGDDEVFTRAQLVEYFGFDTIGKAGGVWNKEKLLWLNNHWMKQTPVEELAPLFVTQLARRGLTAQDDARTRDIVKLHVERAKTLGEMADHAHFFFTSGVTIDEKAGTKELLGNRPLLEAVRARLATGSFEVPALEEWMKSYAESNQLKLGKVAQPIRVAVTGNTVSPPLFDTLVLVGKDECLARLDAALAWVQAKVPPGA